MFAKILRGLFRRPGSKHESKHQSKRMHTETRRNPPKRFDRTTEAEVRLMRTLYRQGHSIHGIAKETTRSSRTVYQRLTNNGTKPLPERDLDSDSAVPRPKKDGRRRRKRHQQTAAQKPAGQFDFARAFMAKAGPQLLEASLNRLGKDPDFARQIVEGVTGVKLPKKSLDDIAQEVITSDPVLRSRWAEAHLDHMIRGGRTDMDILKEGMELLIPLAKELNRDTWPGVVRALGVSGEISRIAELLKGAVSRDDQAGSGGLRRGLPETTASSSVPSDLTPEIPLHTPPTRQRKRHNYLAIPDIASLLQAPLPDFTEQAAQILLTIGKSPEPTS